MRRSWIIVGLMLQADLALGQASVDDVKKCAGLLSDAERLNCFDDLARASKRRIESGAASESQKAESQPTPSPTASPATIAPATTAAPSQKAEDQSVATPSAKASSTTFDIVDFLVDGREQFGKTVTVSGCNLNVTGNTAVCRAAGGYFMIKDFKNKEDLRQSLRECSGSTTCPVTVRGIPKDQFGNLVLEQVEIVERR